jgi:hypothetical protein
LLNSFDCPVTLRYNACMGKKVTYERWINLYLPDGWTEREEMGYVLMEKEGWPGMVQLTFIERDETKMPPIDAARTLLEDTLEERDIPFPREAVKAETRKSIGSATMDYTFQEKDGPTHWRIWFLVDKTRALMAAYISDPEHDIPFLDEATRIINDIEFIPNTSD